MTESNTQNLLQQITELSHEFGSELYVRGGGGNTSVKNETTLWVKPSGTTLKGLTIDSFIAMDRAKMAKLYDAPCPSEPAQRETLVKDMMADSILPTSSGRASVEAPLHESLENTFVVHTHPALVNGMTCAKDGAKVCGEIFPDALWIDYIDPGYTLCMKVRKDIQDYSKKHGTGPSLIFLKNHGVFVAGDTQLQIRQLYSGVITKLRNEYEKKNVSTEFTVSDMPTDVDVESMSRQICDLADCKFTSCSGLYGYINGPVTPDHIVYAKSYLFVGTPSEAKIKDFQSKHGYVPTIIVWDNVVFGLGQTQVKADIALELSKDAAFVAQLTEAFGSLELMTDDARGFIENWEVESYRSKQL